MSEGDKPEPPGDTAQVNRDTQQRASMAQLLLLARLKARNRRDLAVDSMDRAAHVIFVTCKNWFSTGRAQDAAVQSKPPPDGAQAISPDNNDKDTDAHRDH